MNLPIPRGPSIIANPEVLRHSPPDMRFGIPAEIYNGVDAATQQWLLHEARRQVAERKRVESDAAAERRRHVQHVLNQAGRAIPGGLLGQLHALQSLLFEVATIAGQLADALPGDATHDTKDETP